MKVKNRALVFGLILLFVMNAFFYFKYIQYEYHYEKMKNEFEQYDADMGIILTDYESKKDSLELVKIQLNDCHYLSRTESSNN